MLGELIRKGREQKGYTLGQLASKTNIDKSVISKIENHKNINLRTKTVIKLSKALNISVTDIIAEIEKSLDL